MAKVLPKHAQQIITETSDNIPCRYVLLNLLFMYYIILYY